MPFSNKARMPPGLGATPNQRRKEGGGVPISNAMEAAELPRGCQGLEPPAGQCLFGVFIQLYADDTERLHCST